jgi:hypothetical protein
MICVQLYGGLGNQLFQYSAGRALAIRHATTLYLDTVKLGMSAKGSTPRSYELNVFSHAASILSDEMQRPRLIMRCLPRLSNFIFSQNILQEANRHYDQNFDNASDNTYLIGYWQSYRYFSGVEDWLINDFQLKKPLSWVGNQFLTKICSSNSVALHIRRGDYVTNKSANKHHGVIPINYYWDAIKIIKETTIEPIFYIFSDDQEWSRKNFLSLKNAIFVDNNLDMGSWEDLYLMGFCRHHIIANSSFSWWGAWFADRRWGINRKVILPRRWFSKSNVEADMAPKHWISI